MNSDSKTKWNADYDVLILGFGGAGGTAARFAADKDSHVLLVDAAPYGHEGGNTRYSAQHVAMAHNLDLIKQYYDQLANPYDYSKETMNTYLEGFVDMPNYFEKYLDTKAFIWSKDFKPSDHLAHKAHLCEYPEYKGSETFDFALMHNRDFDAELWKKIRLEVLNRKENIDVWLNSRAVELIQNPISKVVEGAVIERNHKKYYIHAKNGVVMSMGGFENNPKMQQDYLHVTKLTPLGTLFNRGDGIGMAQSVGAKMWHMSNYESLGIIPSYVIHEEDNVRGRQIGHWKNVKSGSILAIADDGTRFMREDAKFRHGHIYDHGDYVMPHAYDNAWLIFDDKQYQKFVEEKEAGQLRYRNLFEKIVSSDDISELANKIKVPVENLKKTIKTFNKFVDDGVDMQFGRDIKTMDHISAEKLYAIKLSPAVLNTQGGPEHDEKARVLGSDNTPIPHLYSAGEFGGMCVNRYQGGGNLAECLIFGKIAGEEAAKDKAENNQVEIVDEIPRINDLVDGDRLSDIKLGPDQYLGSTEAGIGGRIVVRVTYKDKTIKNVEVLENHETEGIGAVAIEKLPKEIVKANNTDVDAVSGASTTTRALEEAVNKAINQAN